MSDDRKPRVWRERDAEPGVGVRCVMDRHGDLWQRAIGQGWIGTLRFGTQSWAMVMNYAPVVEVILPEPVLA